MTVKKLTGTCLCGAVTIAANTEIGAFDACHCGTCRKWGGGPALTVDAGSNFTISGEDFIATYQSSEWAERGFCKRCGTHLFYRLQDGSFWNFSLGIFDHTESLRFRSQIYVDSKHGSYSFANKTEELTEAQVIEKFNQR